MKVSKLQVPNPWQKRSYQSLVGLVGSSTSRLKIDVKNRKLVEGVAFISRSRVFASCVHYAPWCGAIHFKRACTSFLIKRKKKDSLVEVFWNTLVYVLWYLWQFYCCAFRIEIGKFLKIKETNEVLL